MKYNAEFVKKVWAQYGIDHPVLTEHKFHPVRKWRFDFCFPEQRVAVEVQGGIFIQGRHSRGAALLKEWEKLNTAAAMGFRVLFCQPKDVTSSVFCAQLKEALTIVPKLKQ